jgi:hypothetical protein
MIKVDSGETLKAEKIDTEIYMEERGSGSGQLHGTAPDTIQPGSETWYTVGGTADITRNGSGRIAKPTGNYPASDVSVLNTEYVYVLTEQIKGINVTFARCDLVDLSWFRTFIWAGGSVEMRRSLGGGSDTVVQTILSVNVPESADVKTIWVNRSDTLEYYIAGYPKAHMNISDTSNNTNDGVGFGTGTSGDGHTWDDILAHSVTTVLGESGGIAETDLHQNFPETGQNKYYQSNTTTSRTIARNSSGEIYPNWSAGSGLPILVTDCGFNEYIATMDMYILAATSFVIRHQDSDNYLRVRCSNAGLNIDEVVGGSVTNLANSAISLTNGEKLELRVLVTEDTVDAWIDNKANVYCTASTTRFNSSTEVGYFHLSNTNTDVKWANVNVIGINT